MEESMAETAVGLFQHASTADSVVDALRANGLPSNGIRTLAKPTAMPVESSISKPSVDFAAELSRDLRSIGATPYECEAYLAGLRSGNVLVLATGSRAQADTAISVMNAYDPIEIEEFAGAVESLSNARNTEAVGTHEGIALKPEQERARSEGARVFSW
jgi:hypothetical protein